MKTTTGRPSVAVSADGSGIVAHAGGVLLVETAAATGLERALSQAMAPWRASRAVHDPGKTVLDVAISLALGGDCLADVGVLRAEPGVYGPVASDPTVSRLVDRLAARPYQALGAIRTARAAARERAWALAGEHAATAGGKQLIIDVDATLVTAHSDKEYARPTYKKTFGFHPILAYLDHGVEGTGEPLAGLLRPGNAGANTAADHIDIAALALAQLPKRRRRGRRTLMRADAGGATHEFLNWITRPGRALSYSIGFPIGDELREAILAVPARAWTPAYNADGKVRDGAWVAEITGMCDLSAWPAGMRVIVRTPARSWRSPTPAGTGSPASSPTPRPGNSGDLEARHRRRARVEDRIRAGKDTGLANLPLPRLRRQPDLVRTRRPGPRPHRLDPDTRSYRPRRQTVGTQTTAATPIRRGRAARAHRTQTAAATGTALALDQRPHQRDHPAPNPHRTRLTSTNTAPTSMKGTHGADGTPPPGATAGQPNLRTNENPTSETNNNTPLRPSLNAMQDRG